MRCQGIKGGLCFKKEISFLSSSTIMGPKLTLLFQSESDEEANKAIQEAEDTKAELMHLNEGLCKFNWKADMAKC